mgnify:FL=1
MCESGYLHCRFSAYADRLYSKLFTAALPRLAICLTICIKRMERKMEYDSYF